MLGIGVDLGSIAKVSRIIDNYNDNELAYLYSQDELYHCRKSKNPIMNFAISFSAKEAVGKAFGTGLANLLWHEIQALPGEYQIEINLMGSAREKAHELGISRWLTTFSVNEDLVYVVAVAL